MIQLFYIKKKRKQMKKQMKVADAELLKNYLETSSKTKEELTSKLQTNIETGLTEKKVSQKLEENGYNIVVKNEKHSPLYFFINSFNDKFIFILLALSVISLALKDNLGAVIIAGISVVSALIRFFQDYSVYKFNQKLKASISTTANVLRNSKEKTVKVENIVPGDIVHLNAGAIIPADLMIIESKDLFITQSAFTGESVLVEKTKEFIPSKEIFSLNNICLMGASVVSGSATAVVINTGFSTYLGKMSKEIDTKHEPTNFEKGMDSITKLLIKYMLLVSIFVFIIFGFLRQNIVEALLFALSVAVGITPSMLPMIVNVNLTKGCKTLAKKNTLVKNISSIQNLGAIDILCTDKTGTLTMDKIVLQKYINVMGEEDLEILEYAYINSKYGTGIKNLVDRAIISYGKEHNIENTLDKYEKIDEIPFDYMRKKMSVVVKSARGYRMITKGALEEVLKSCSSVKYKGKTIPITEKHITQIKENAEKLALDGMQVIALAAKREYKGVGIFSSKDEEKMTFIGYVAFLDPPKKDVKNTILKLKKIGVSTKILTGDNKEATKNICNLVGLNSNEIITGDILDTLPDEELAGKLETVDVFARLNPLQKERVVSAYKNAGHVVGYMGDGVNDAPSLHNGDIGICVNTATDIAKEASDIIILKKSLDVIYDGIIEGRKVYGNIIKYMKMALSADFGDVFSILIASIFLPFLPLLPIQMLIQDFIYDISQIAIPYDDVDPEFLAKPKKWNTKGLRKFMNVMGITSSITDVLAFIGFWFFFGFNSEAKQAYFQTAWFVECLISELLIIHFIRTPKIPFVQSRANSKLTLLTLVSIVLTIITPILLSSIPSFNFVILPPTYYIFVILLVAIYTILVQTIKKIYIKKYGEWL